MACVSSCSESSFQQSSQEFVKGQQCFWGVPPSESAMNPPSARDRMSAPSRTASSTNVFDRACIVCAILASIEARDVVSEDDGTLIRFVVPRLPLVRCHEVRHVGTCPYCQISVEMLIAKDWKLIIEYPGVPELPVCIHHSFHLVKFHLYAKQLVASGVGNWRNRPSRLAILQYCPIHTLCQ